MNKAKKETITASVMAFVESNVQKPKTITYEIPDFDPIVVTVKITVPFTVRAEVVRLIDSMVFLNGGNSFEDYVPENLEFAKRYAIISYFTDFKLPTDVNDAWLVLYNTPLYCDVMKIVGDYAAELFDVANNLINAKLDNIAKKSPFDSLVSTLEEKIKGFDIDFSQDDMKSVLEALKKIPRISTDDILGAVVKAQEEKDNK